MKTKFKHTYRFLTCAAVTVIFLCLLGLKAGSGGGYNKDFSYVNRQVANINPFFYNLRLGIGLFIMLSLLGAHYFFDIRWPNRMSTATDGSGSFDSENQMQLLTKLLIEKELIIKEIHHRIKNNLQVVVSLLNTQSSFLDNERALAALQNSQHRIYAMSLIHQKLYQSDNLESIDMASYIHELSRYLNDTIDPENHITFVYELKELYVDITDAVPLGLIVNEAISNSIKYAFTATKHGKITITLGPCGDDNYHLTIVDNGAGLPADFNEQQTATMGMSLMRGLANQLKGSFTYASNPGLTISVLFKNRLSGTKAANAA